MSRAMATRWACLVLALAAVATGTSCSSEGPADPPSGSGSDEDAAEAFAAGMSAGAGDYEPFDSVEGMARDSDVVAVGTLVAVRDSLVIPLDFDTDQTSTHLALQVRLTDVVSQRDDDDLEAGDEVFVEVSDQPQDGASNLVIDGIDRVMVFLTDMNEERFPPPVSDPLADERDGMLWGAFTEGILLEDSGPGVVAARTDLPSKGPDWQFESIDHVVERLAPTRVAPTVTE